MNGRENKKIGGKLLKAVILSVSLVTMINNSVSVVLGNMQEAFPEVSTVKLQCLLAYPTFSMIIMVLVGGVLVSYLGNKIILLSGLLIYTVSGVMPVFLSDFNYILLSRLCMGAGLGLVSPLALGLITDFYEGNERVTAMGQQFGVGNFGQAAALLSAGILGAMGWRYSFLIYGSGAVIFFLILFLLPEKEKRKKADGKKGTVGVNARALCVAGIMGFYNMVYIVMHSNLSLVMTSRHIGTVMTTSYSMTLMTLISTGAGLIFGKLYEKIRELVGVMSGLFIAFAIMIMADRPWMVYLSLAFLGAGNALIMPFGFYHVTKLCPEGAEKFCLAMTQAFLSVGSFLSPFVVDGLRRFLSGEGDGFPFWAALAGMGILNMVLITYWFVMKRKRLCPCSN